MKYYLAFKAVNSNLESIFVEGKLCRRYSIGKSLRCPHPELPFWIIDYCNCFLDNWREVFTGHPFCKMLLVRIPCHCLVKGRVLNYDCRFFNGNVKKLIREGMVSYLTGGATFLKVLEEVDMQKLPSPLGAKSFYEEKYKIRFAK